MPPEDDDEVTIRGLFEDAISEGLQRTARAGRDAAEGLAETGAGGETAALGMDRASIAAGRLKHELEGVDRAAEQQRLSQLRLMAAESEATRIRSKGVLTAGEAARVEGMLSHARADAQRSTRDLAAAHDVLSRATDNLGMRLLRTAGSVGFLTTMFKGLKLVATVNVFTSLIGGVSSLGAAGVAAVAGLAPLLGTAGALPALGLAALSAFAGVALLTGGVMSAVKAMESAGPGSVQASAALNRLGPSSARLAYDVYGLTFSLRNMREEAMRTALPYFEHTIGNVQRLLPVLRTGFVGVTEAVGQTAQEATDRMVGASGDLNLIMERNAILVRTLGHGVVDTLDAGRHIMVGAGPMVQGFADKFAGEMKRVDASLAANPGKVEAFFSRVFDRTMAIVHVLSDFGHGFVSLLHGAAPLTDHMGAGITKSAEEFRSWAASAEGQNSIHKFFTDAIPVVDAMMRLLGQVGHSLGELSTNAGTAGMLNELSTALPILTQLLVLIEKISNTIPGANSALAMLFIANRFGLSPAILGRGAAGVVRGGTLFSRGVRGVEGVEGGFAGRTSGSMLGRLGARAGGLLGIGGGAEAAAGGAAAAEGGGALAGAGAGLAGLLAAIPVVGWIAAAVIAIGVGAWQLYEHWKPFRDAVDATGRWFERIGKYIGHDFMAAVHGVVHAWDSVVAAFKTAYDWVAKIVEKAKDIGGTIVHKVTHPWELVGLYTGGPLAAGQPALVGERGPELFYTAGTMRVVGGDGAELMASRTPGFVLPNEALRSMESLSVRQAAAKVLPVEPVMAPVFAAVGGGSADRELDFAGLPPINIGPVYAMSDVDLSEAVAEGLRAWDRERKDRR